MYGLASVWIYSDLSLAFPCWVASPASWSVLSSLAMQYVSANRPYNDSRCNPEGFGAYQQVDVGGFIDHWVCLRPWKTPDLWE